MKRDEMPVGLGMALAQNPTAMKKFANLSSEEQQKIIDGTHAIHSKQEMHAYVDHMVLGEYR